jgi:hypothetical protein
MRKTMPTAVAAATGRNAGFARDRPLLPLLPVFSADSGAVTSLVSKLRSCRRREEAPAIASDNPAVLSKTGTPAMASEALGLHETVAVGEGEVDGEIKGATDADKLVLLDTLAVIDCDSLADPLLVCDWLALPDCDGDAEPVPLPDELALPLLEPLGVRDELWLRVMPWLRVRLCVAERVALGVRVCEGERVGVSVRLWLGERVWLGVRVIVGVRVRDALCDGVTPCVRVCDFVPEFA